MNIQQIFYKNTLRNFAYLITFDDGQIYGIDPFSASEIKGLLGKDEKLTGLINTHDHCDHYSGNTELLENSSCPVMCHPEAFVPRKTRGLSDGELIHSFNSWSLEALHTPGHTLSHLCLLLKKDELPYALFTGDCFFNAGVGNCHNGGDPKVLYHTISEIFSTFPDEMLIYPGHEYLKRNLEFSQSIDETNNSVNDFLDKIQKLNLDEVFFVNSMKVEREINTFLKLESKIVRKKLGLLEASNQEVFIRLREMRNLW